MGLVMHKTRGSDRRSGSKLFRKNGLRSREGSRRRRALHWTRTGPSTGTGRAHAPVPNRGAERRAWTVRQPRAPSAERQQQRPRRGRGRLDGWARRRSFCMEWARLLVQTSLRVQRGASTHDHRMSHTRVTVDDGVRAQELKSAGHFGSAAEARRCTAPLVRAGHQVRARGAEQARAASESASSACSTGALRGGSLDRGRCWRVR